MHKPTLKKERAIRYDEKGTMQMINNMDKVYNEIEVWAKIRHPNIIRIYEMLDDDSHDYLYLIMELADLGQLATWNYKVELYERNEMVYALVLKIIAEMQVRRQ